MNVRLLFWTVWAQTAKIEQSYLDGSNRHSIVDSDLGMFLVLYGLLSAAGTVTLCCMHDLSRDLLTDG